MAVVMIFTAVSCEKEIENPVLTDDDLVVFLYGQGGTPHGIAWEGYDVELGDSLEIRMQVSPASETKVKWELHDKEYITVEGDTVAVKTTATLLNETLSYTFKPTEAGLQRTYFIASRQTGDSSEAVADTVVFNFRGGYEGGVAPVDVESIINSWQSFNIPQGPQNGSFTAEFDMVAGKDGIDAVLGFNNGAATSYGDLSCIVRFDRTGIIDAYNGATYMHENNFPYTGGVTYHIRMEVDMVTMKYSVFASETGGSEVIIAQDYSFRNKLNEVDSWSIVAGNWNLTEPGTHRITNMVITTNSINENPIIIGIDDVEMFEGEVINIPVKSIDPLGGSLVLEVSDLPRFAKFTPTSNGNGVISLEPYENCGGCDVGNFTVTISATNKMGTTEEAFNITVNPAVNSIQVTADIGDATVWPTGQVVNDYIHLFGGAIGDVGVSGEAADVVGVLPFKLPEVPEGKEIESVYLTLTVAAQNAWVDVNYDVYALDARNTPEVLATDYFIGDYGTDANATAIQNGFMTKADAVAADPDDPNLNNTEFTMSDDGAINLADFINAQYAGGATAGQYVFIRYAADRTMPTWAHIQYESADTDAPGSEPVLMINWKNK